MLIEASEQDRNKILDYCLNEPTMNLFLIGDIENFGFSNDFQQVWYQEKQNEIVGVILRYHTMLIVYSKDLNMDFILVNNILVSNDIDVISGKSTVIDLILDNIEEEYKRTNNKFCELNKLEDLSLNLEDIKLATIDDAMEIAIAYGGIEEFKNLYSNDVNKRFDQIETRISSGEGKHLFIKDSKGIIAHGNTTAEASTMAMVGGIFTREDMRNKGYGTLITYALINDLISRNKKPCLFYTDEKQGRLFKKLGFEYIGDWSMLRR